MFELRYEKLKSQENEIKKRLKEIEKEKNRLDKILCCLDNDRKALKALENSTDKAKTSAGEQSYRLSDDAFENINKNFIKDVNEWVRQHEENFHPASYFQTKDYLKNKSLYILPSYNVSIDWTHLGRFISIECETCKKHCNKNAKQEDYMFLDEA